MEPWHNPKEGKPLPYLLPGKYNKLLCLRQLLRILSGSSEPDLVYRGKKDVFPAQFRRSIYELLLEIPDPTLLSAGRKSDRKLKPGQKAILSVKAWSLMGPGAFSLMRCASSMGRQWDANSLKAKREADTGGQGSCAGEETQTMQWQTLNCWGLAASGFKYKEQHPGPAWHVPGLSDNTPCQDGCAPMPHPQSRFSRHWVNSSSKKQTKYY